MYVYVYTRIIDIHTLVGSALSDCEAQWEWTWSSSSLLMSFGTHKLPLGRPEVVLPSLRAEQKRENSKWLKLAAWKWLWMQQFGQPRQHFEGRRSQTQSKLSDVLSASMSSAWWPHVATPNRKHAKPTMERRSEHLRSATLKLFYAGWQSAATAEWNWCSRGDLNRKNPQDNL